MEEVADLPNEDASEVVSKLSEAAHGYLCQIGHKCQSV